jgi:hypothetical protein
VVEGTTQPEYTVDELVELALEAGFEASVRLICDWESLGLLDSPRRRPLGRGRGSQKGVWSEAQKNLFLSLLHHRRQLPANRVAGLANIPVWLWLWWGDDFVPLRQARKALATWCGRHRTKAGVSASEARRMSRRFAETVVQPHTHPRDTAALRRVVEESLQTMSFDHEAFREAVRRVFDPHAEGRTIGPAGAPMSTDIVVRAVEARFSALHALDDLTDSQWEDARFIYVVTKIDYAQEQPDLAKHPLTGKTHQPPSLEGDVNKACFDLLTILGMSLLAPEGHHQLAAEARQRIEHEIEDLD